MDIINTVKNTIKNHNMLQAGDTVVVGISGGADSICLLYILNQIKTEFNINLIAVHINHNLRGKEALYDQRFVTEFCNDLKIKLEIFSINIEETAKNNGLSLEEAGRIERYKTFNSLKADKIAVAHHLNDSCETMLMRLFRGSGIKGLTGILPVRNNIIRPLINVTRAEIEEFCNQNNLEYCTDSTNSEDIYTRNKIRIHLIPWIKEHLNSNILTTLSKTGYMLSQEEDYLNTVAHNEYSNALVAPGVLNTDKLKQLHPAILNRVIRICCENITSTLKDISFEHINSISQLMDKPSGKKINLPYCMVAIKEDNNIKIYVDDSKEFCYDLAQEMPVYIPECNLYALLSKNVKKGNFLYTYGFNCDIIKGKIQLRSRLDGDVFATKNGDRKLKKIMNDIKLPVSQRKSIPLLADESKVFCIIGRNISTSYSDEQNNLFLYLWEE